MLHHRPVARLLALLALFVAIVGTSARAQPPSVHLTLGNPSGAVADLAQPMNYLISRAQYALAYHRDRGIPTWVSWHLEQADLGTVERYSGPFFSDTTLPAGWYRVRHDDYTSSGYDRGHMTPSADRTTTTADNEATFLLTNVVPQTPASNQGPWAQLEDELRDRVRGGNEAYIVAGAQGSRGTIAGGNVIVPEALWKVAVVLPTGDNDLARIGADTTVLAVWIPKDTSVPQSDPWQPYQTTVGCIEQRNGLDLLAALDDAVEAALTGVGCVAPSAYRAYLPLVIGATAAPQPQLPQVTITNVVFDPPGDDLAGEYVLLRNLGQAAATLTSWTLRDEAGAIYTFPTFTLAASAEVRVWVKAGTNDGTNLYWGRSQPIWNNTGDTATLRDTSGAEISRFTYP
jgi:endonuclease G